MKIKSIRNLTAGTCLASGLWAGLLVGHVQAFTPYTVNDANGNPAFELRLFAPQDGVFYYSPQGPSLSTWTIDNSSRDRVRSAAQYWANIIMVTPGANPAIVNVGTEEEENAGAFSPPATDANGVGTLVGAALNNHSIKYKNLDVDYEGFRFNAHAIVTLGRMDWDWQHPFVPSQLILTPKVDMTSTLVHELAHALGIGADVESDQETGKPISAVFDNQIGAWTSHLIDDDGKLAQSGQTITCIYCEVTEARNDTFNVNTGFAYFSGAHVSEVLAGALPGIPVRINSSMVPSAMDQAFSHSEFRNSLMSHQNYNNRSTLMEAEFAALQDIGYQLDRRNLFGFSVYNDDVTLTNDNPFFARSADGTTYIANSYNMATMGLGLDVYGSNINVSQRANLLSAGAGGGGIRVDGFDNAVTILPGTKVYADGSNGLGVVFAYGKGNRLTQRGEVQALGENGIAVAFDFGHNSNGDAQEYRGSYFVTSQDFDLQADFPDYYSTALAEVSGPLVSTFDLTGRVAGSKAAIYASESGYVGTINVMQGASISGDIISEYYEFDEDDNLRLTEINFGLKADSDGHATEGADPQFTLAYDGNIIGENISLSFEGGLSTLSGSHETYEVVVMNGATLAGRGSYVINRDRRFNQHGILNPSIIGDAITIDGEYYQTATGKLQLQFNDQKQISKLIVNDKAILDGTIRFVPNRGFYPNGFALTSNQWISADSFEGSFADVTTNFISPTLIAEATDNGSNSYTVSLTRGANAYSQYGYSDNGKAVGLALDQLANGSANGMQPLFAALDFSAADGSTIRSALPQLSGEAYASANGLLIKSSGAIRSSVNARLSQAFGGTPANPVTVLAFGPEEKAKTTPASAAIDQIATSAIPPEDLSRYAAWGSVFGLWTSQSDDGNAARTKSTLGGFVSGIDASVYDNWRLGVMAGYSRSTFKTGERNSSGSSDNYTIGAYTGTEWDTANGEIGFRSGLAYSWHNIEMSRSVAFNGFSDSLSGDYNAGTFQAFGELGYKYKVTERSVLEPYANLAYVHVNTDSFTEQGLNGAALSVTSGSMDTGLSTLGLRTSTRFVIGNMSATARADLGWRHAFGDVLPMSTASFAASSGTFTSVGNSIGKDTALIEAGLDFAFTKNAKLGIAYQGQFGSGLTQNGVNALLSVSF